MRVTVNYMRPVLIWLVALIVTFFCLHLSAFKNAIVNTSLNLQSHGIDWETIDFDQLTPEQVLEYVNWSNRSSCQLVHDFGGQILRSPSGLDGQKAVCLDPVQLAPPFNNCVVYSFGISEEWSFDEAMADYGCQVYAFDPSMERENHDHTPAIHFFNIGLGNQTLTNSDGWKFLPLSYIYERLKSRHGDGVIDYLKMDIEFDEWKVIPQIIQSGMMDNIRQLAIEIHLHYDYPLIKMRDCAKIIRSIEKSGMIRFDSKLNPWSRYSFISLNGTKHPFAYEIAWYNSKFL